MRKGKFKIKSIWAVVIWADPNKGWGSEDLYLVENRDLAEKIAKKISPMDGARVRRRTLIVGEK